MILISKEQTNIINKKIITIAGFFISAKICSDNKKLSIDKRKTKTEAAKLLSDDRYWY